jgi:hypothetical protein
MLDTVTWGGGNVRGSTQLDQEWFPAIPIEAR